MATCFHYYFRTIVIQNILMSLFLHFNFRHDLICGWNTNHVHF